MLTPQSLPWIEPLTLAAAVREPYWALLYSGTRTSYSGRYSYLACQLAEKISSNDFSVLKDKLSDAKPLFDNAWFGLLSYGLKNSLEQLPQDEPNWLTLPALLMMRFHTIYQFDHDEKTLTCWSDAKEIPYTQASTEIQDALPKVTSFGSPMSEAEYLQKAGTVLEHIKRGDLYQANLTRKFTGEFETAPNYFSVFRELCRVSPAPYSAFFRLDDIYIASSSPELFLRADNKGYVETRPIKGTAPRFSDAARDAQSLQALADSSKDKAENLMITDLMRNDLARTCIPGSVKVEKLFETTSHATIHHMSSTVTGQKASQHTTLDVVEACFPPGSMTGAPKIRAMELCSKLEQLERGIYSGALGWFGGDGGCELSVVIRTLVMKGRKFEFQVGGGIVADSTPEKELQEIVFKSNGIIRCLGLDKAATPAHMYAQNA
jgi:para-aminobenzoate synthetase component 1